MGHVTVRDVAEAAGVSLTTVSRVSNAHPDLAPSTRTRVQRVIDNLGYTPSNLAKNLRMNKTGTIGVVISDISNPFFGAVVRGIENAARQRGYTIILLLMKIFNRRKKQSMFF